MSETSQTSSENEKSKKNRPPRKRQVHNEVERRRKDKINSWISKISELLPNKELHKQSKISILEQTVYYIKELVVERDKLLSEQCSDVQIEEVRKLKKELNLIQEQNRMYVKLLQQANISLGSLPKKAANYKYSNKFTERNGMQLLQQVEQANRCPSPPQVETVVQNSSSVQNSNDALASASQVLPTSVTAARTSSIREPTIQTTAGNVLSPTAGCNAQSVSTVPLLPACVACTKSPVPLSSAFINSQGAIPSFTSGSTFSAKATVSVGTGGVTPALSPFPLMSTTLSSSVSDIYSKSVRVVLMPSTTPIPAERVTLSNLNIAASSLVQTLPISVPKTVANHCIISPLNYGNTLSVLPEPALISNGVQIAADALPNSAVCINVANGFLNSGFIIAPMVTSSSNTSACVKVVSQANVHSNNISEIVSTLPLACENLQSVVPPAVPLTEEPTVFCSTSQITIPSIPQASCTKVLLRAAGNAPGTHSQVLAAEPLGAKAPNTSTNNARLIVTDMGIVSHAAEQCVTATSESHVTQPESSSNLDANGGESFTEGARVQAMPASSPLSLKMLCTKKMMLFSRYPNEISSHLSFLNISDSLHEEMVQFQSNDSVSTLHPALVNHTKNAQNSPSASNLQIQCDSDSSGVPSNISTEVSSTNDIFQHSQEKNELTDTSLNSHNDVTNTNGIVNGSKDHPLLRCSSVISDSSNGVFTSDSEVQKEVIEPQKSVTGDGAARDPSTDPRNAYHNPSSCLKSKFDALNENVVCSSASSVNASHSALPKSSAGVDLPTSPSKNYPVTVSECTGQTVNSGHTPSSQASAGPITLPVGEHINTSKSPSMSEPLRSNSAENIPQSDAPSFYSSNDLNCPGLHVSRIDSEKSSASADEGSLNSSALPSLFHNSQYFNSNPPCISFQPSCNSSVSTPITSTLTSGNKSNLEKSTVLSSVNLSLSSIGYNSLLPAHNVIPLMTPVNSLAPSYCIGASDKNCSNLLADKSGTLSFPIILGGYSDCDVVESKNIFSNVDANFSINFLNTSFSSASQKLHPCPSKKRGKSVAKKAKATVKTKTCETSPDGTLQNNCSNKFQPPVEVPSSDMENMELHKASMEQPSLFLTNDILAKATESIFCNTILDGGQGSSECQEEIISSVAEHSPALDPGSVVSEHFVSVGQAKPSLRNESIKKNPVCVAEIAKPVNVCSLNQCDSKRNEIISTPSAEKEDGNNQKEKSLSRIRKSSSLEESEPLSKRAKEEVNKPKDSTPTQSTRQTEFYVNKLVAQESSLKDKEETLCSAEIVNRENSHVVSNLKDSNGIQSVCGNTKSVSSSETAFTPSLGEILKDVSHGMLNFNPRSTIPADGESHRLLPTEKSIVAADSCTRNAADDFMQLPQSYFSPSTNVNTPQLSSASEILRQPVVSQANGKAVATNNISRPDNKKKVVDHWTEKSNGSILPYANILKEKDSNNGSKHGCGSEASPQPPSDSNVASTFLYPESNNVMPNISTSEIIPVSPSKSISSQFGVQNVCSSIMTSMLPPNINFNRVQSSQVQQNFLHASPPPLLSRNYGCQNTPQGISFPPHSAENLNSGITSQSPSSNSESLSHSLCSLLKDTSSQPSNIPGKSVANSRTTMQSTTLTYSSTPTTSISHSKYSALSLISHQSYSGSPSGINTSLPLIQPSMMSAPSCQQISNTPSTTHSICGNRNTRVSLSYSAENLIHSQVVDVDKDKNKTIGYFPHKKAEQDLVPNLHDVGDSNIFMPLGSSEINTQSMSIVPLPPVTSFPTFPSNYSMCDAAPPVSLRCGGATQDLPLQLPNEGSFLRHSSINEPPTPAHNDRHMTHGSNMGKPHSNLSLSFDSHTSFYNNCNFLQHPKTNLDSSAVPDGGPCFQTTAFNSGYAQSIQKQNCCHFSHQGVGSHTGLIPDTSLPIITSVGPFHTDKNDNLMNRPSLETNSSQSCSNYIGNIFYDSSCSRQVVGTKPSSMTLSQELYSPLGMRQNSSHHSAPSSTNIQRKNVVSGKNKSKKVKQAPSSESGINTNATSNSSNVNFFSVPEISCSKSSVPNCYFKSSHQTPSSLQSPSENKKLPENILGSSIPPNPPFNSILHSQNDGILNLNFQPPNFGMSSLSRPPPPASLCCSCITSPVITQTFTTAATHPVPNFNLSNILPDMGCSSGESVTLSPIKFHPPSHILAAPPPPSISSQCQADSSQGASGHSLSRQASGPTLYPPHPPVIHNTFSPLLNHTPHGLNRSHAPISGSGTSCTAPQGATFVPTQPPPFRNVIQSLNFTRSDR